MKLGENPPPVRVDLVSHGLSPSDQLCFAASVTDHQVVFRSVRTPIDRIVRMKRPAILGRNVRVRDAEAAFVEKQVHHLIPRVSGSFYLCKVKPMTFDLPHVVPFPFLLERRVLATGMRKPLVHEQFIGLFEGLENRFLTTGKQKYD